MADISRECPRARRASAAAMALSTASTGSEATMTEVSGLPCWESSQVLEPDHRQGVRLAQSMADLGQCAEGAVDGQDG